MPAAARRGSWLGRWFALTHMLLTWLHGQLWLRGGEALPTRVGATGCAGVWRRVQHTLGVRCACAAQQGALLDTAAEGCGVQQQRQRCCCMGCAGRRVEERVERACVHASSSGSAAGCRQGCECRHAVAVRGAAMVELQVVCGQSCVHCMRREAMAMQRQWQCCCMHGVRFLPCERYGRWGACKGVAVWSQVCAVLSVRVSAAARNTWSRLRMLAGACDLVCTRDDALPRHVCLCARVVTTATCTTSTARRCNRDGA
jgi:hypothetical protein